jgi:hypothetical protein
VAQLGEAAGLHGAPVLDDADPVAQGLDLGEDVAGEQDRAPLLPDLVDVVAEDPIHQRVQPEVGSSSSSSSTSEASAATRATFCRLPLE